MGGFKITRRPAQQAAKKSLRGKRGGLLAKGQQSWQALCDYFRFNGLQRFSFRSLHVGPSLLLSAVLVLGYFVLQQLYELGPLRLKNPQVLFEVKVIDALGQPVPGASAYLGNRKVGVTDSFGEWRGFFRVPQGKTLSLNLVKKTPTTTLHVAKNLLVPLGSPAKGGLSVRATLQLQPLGAELPVKTELAAAVTEVQAQPNPRPLRPSQRASYQAVWFSLLGQEPQEPFHAQRQQKAQKVLAALKKIAEQQGLLLNKQAAWQVALSPVPLATQPGGRSELLRVLAWKEGGGQQADFLTAYTGHAQQTALSLLQTLKLHTPQSFALVQRGESWALQASELPFWRLKKGQYLRTAQGKLLRVLGSEAAGLNSKVPGFYTLDLQQASACASAQQHRCLATQAHLPLDPPGAQWAQTKVRIIGFNQSKEKEANVYVAGLKASYEGAQQWRFWIQTTDTAYVPSYLSIELEGALIFRQLVDPAQQKILILPPSATALVRK